MRKNNQGAWDAWQRGRFYQSGSVSTRQMPDGNWAIYSYAVPILYFNYDPTKGATGLILNLTKYSVTTSTLQNYLRYECNRGCWTPTEITVSAKR